MNNVNDTGFDDVQRAETKRTLAALLTAMEAKDKARDPEKDLRASMERSYREAAARLLALWQEQEG